MRLQVAGFFSNLLERRPNQLRRLCRRQGAGARFVDESGAGPDFARIHDRALFTIDGARIASPANQPAAAFDISRLDGRFTILSTHITSPASGPPSVQCKAMTPGIDVTVTTGRAFHPEAPNAPWGVSSEHGAAKRPAPSASVPSTVRR